MRVLAVLAILASVAIAGDDAPVTEKQVDGLVKVLRALADKGKKIEATTNSAFVAGVEVEVSTNAALLDGTGLDRADVKRVCAQVVSASTVLLLEKLDRKTLDGNVDGARARLEAAQAEVAESSPESPPDLDALKKKREELRDKVKTLDVTVMEAQDAVVKEKDPTKRKALQDELDALTRKKNATEDAAIETARAYEKGLRQRQDDMDRVQKLVAPRAGALAEAQWAKRAAKDPKERRQVPDATLAIVKKEQADLSQLLARVGAPFHVLAASK